MLVINNRKVTEYKSESYEAYKITEELLWRLLKLLMS
jgi:hypothetical protein